MRRSFFDSMHPVTCVAYFACALICIMSAFHPILQAAGLVLGIAWNIMLNGVRTALAPLRWQLPLLVLIALANPLFVGSGQSVMIELMGQPLYIEALAYGLTMGVMLVSVLQWFSCAARVVTSDKALHVITPALPTVGLMLTMTMRLVPQLVRRGKEVASVHAACTSARPPLHTASGCEGDGTAFTGTAKRKQGLMQRIGRPLQDRLRQITVLMGWSMEDSLESADSIRARGWGAASKRSGYRRTRFTMRDAAQLVLIASITVAAFICGTGIAGRFQFYPTMHGAWFDVEGAFYLALLALPLVCELAGKALWRRYVNAAGTGEDK